MSENITHTAVVDDCLRLMQVSDTICSPFKQAAQKHLSMAHLGCITRAGDRCNPGLLETFRNRWADRQPDDHLEAKLAFVLGWLCHRAADRQMKPIFRRFHPPGSRKERPTECSVYHDAFIFQTIYAYGKEPPYHPEMFGKSFTELREKVNVDSIQSLLQVLLRRVLVEMHTLIPDIQNPEVWIEQLFIFQQDFYVNLQRYDNAINHPDPDKVRLYIIEGNFYDPTEPIINCARKLQHGEPVNSDEVTRALTQNAFSHYAQAVETGYRYLQAASDYFSTNMNLETLRKRLDIGRLGRDGIAV
jgi:hypothetical protein